MKPTPDVIPASERISSAFSKLTESAKNINEVSARLHKQIAALENCLARINVGVACWVVIAKGGGQYDNWSRHVGYARIDGKWCIAISTEESLEWTEPGSEKVEEWPFAEAPRYLQPQAVEKLPELIEALVAATDAAAKRLEEKVAPAEELVQAVEPLAFPKKK